MKKILLFAGIPLIIICVSMLIFGGKKETVVDNGNKPKTKKTDMNLNISIMLDLSDRIDPNSQYYPSISPSHITRDTILINHIVDIVKTNIVKRKIAGCNDKLKIFFSPIPTDPNISDMASKMRFDLSKMKIPEKKKAYHEISNTINSNLSDIYSKVLSSGTWIGSDIWSFFKKDVSLCIDSDPSFRNILVLITDGYIYYNNAQITDGNRHSYILAKDLRKYRYKPNWKAMIEKDDYGLIAHEQDLSNLEILILEITSSCDKPANPYEEDMLCYLLEKWFNEMNVKRCVSYKTDLPVNTITRIDEFF